MGTDPAAGHHDEDWGGVAVVDFTSPDAPAEFTASLLHTGFAVLVNHPLQAPLVQQVFDEWSAFFGSEAKYRYAPEEGTQGGYVAPTIAETAKGNTVRDLKEFFHVYPWSVYPDEVSDAALRYAEKAATVARTLLDWVEANTPPEIAARFSQPLSSMLDGSHRTLLRILRYPALTGDEEPGAVRAAAHEDINLLTVLPAADEPGLEVLDAHGHWHAVPCDPGSITVNTGEMLQHASGGYYRATTHRVVNPTGEAALRPRMSAPLFLHPADDVVLAGGRTAFSFLEERLIELRGQTLTRAPDAPAS